MFKTWQYLMQYYVSSACADPGIFARGVQAHQTGKSSDVLVFLVPNLFYSYTEGVQWLF